MATLLSVILIFDDFPYVRISKEWFISVVMRLLTYLCVCLSVYVQMSVQVCVTVYPSVGWKKA